MFQIALLDAWLRPGKPAAGSWGWMSAKQTTAFTINLQDLRKSSAGLAAYSEMLELSQSKLALKQGGGIA